jgi:hypothetical protein
MALLEIALSAFLESLRRLSNRFAQIVRASVPADHAGGFP